MFDDVKEAFEHFFFTIGVFGDNDQIWTLFLKECPQKPSSPSTALQTNRLPIDEPMSGKRGTVDGYGGRKGLALNKGPY